MDYLPIFFDLKGRKVLVVGAGDVAARKASLLLRAQGRVTVVAPEFSDAMRLLNENDGINFVAAAYEADQLTDCALVIAATNDMAVNRQVFDDASRRSIPVNVADAPELCTFVLPSIIDRSPVMVAVSTGGASPTLGRLLRARLETMIPASYGRLAQLARGFREPVKQRFKTMAQRRRFWEQVIQGQVAELVYANKDQQAEHALQKAIDEADHELLSEGEVYLVGAGPGDPDLLTFRALRLMQQADVVLYDRLVSPKILDLVRREADRIYVGKKRSFHAVRQEEINQQLIDLAKQGKRVLRLKGGDPFIFGRGGEEIAGLAEQKIPFQVVPGVTAAAGCASYAGIPLTHRDYAQSVIFVTGQLKDGTVDLEWQTLAQPRQTVVVYMGMAGLDIICKKLVEHGVSAQMPAALVQQGTTPSQRVFIGTLNTLSDLVAQHEVHAPTLLIIGEVVQLHDQLNWFKPEE